MKTPKTIISCSSAYDVIEKWFPNFFEDGYEKDKELIDYILHFDDFETIAYYLINDQYVMTADSLTGDIFGELTPVEKFYKNIKELYKEEVKA